MNVSLAAAIPRTARREPRSLAARLVPVLAPRGLARQSSAAGSRGTLVPKLRKLETDFKDMPIQSIDLCGGDGIALFLTVTDTAPDDFEYERLKQAAPVFEGL